MPKRHVDKKTFSRTSLWAVGEETVHGEEAAMEFRQSLYEADSLSLVSLLCPRADLGYKDWSSAVCHLLHYRLQSSGGNVDVLPR